MSVDSLDLVDADFNRYTLSDVFAVASLVSASLNLCLCDLEMQK